eukprot:scaffold15518_cov50-Attheya_sp.AAC.3
MASVVQKQNNATYICPAAIFDACAGDAISTSEAIGLHFNRTSADLLRATVAGDTHERAAVYGIDCNGERLQNRMQ